MFRKACLSQKKRRRKKLPNRDYSRVLRKIFLTWGNKRKYHRVFKYEINIIIHKETLYQLKKMEPNAGLPAWSKENQTHETGAGEKESGLFRCPFLEKPETLVPEPTSTCLCRQRFTGRERGTEPGDEERGLESSLHADEHRPIW